MSHSIYSEDRVRKPHVHVLALDVPLLWPLFHEHRRARKRAVEDADDRLIREYMNLAGWISSLWYQPLLSDSTAFVSLKQISRTEDLLPKLPEGSELRNVVRQARVLRQRQKELIDASMQVMEEIAVATIGIEGRICAIESERSRATLDSLDGFRQTIGLDAIVRLKAGRAAPPDCRGALVFGAPNSSASHFKWAFWPPVAPSIVQVVWRPSERYAIPYIDSVLAEQNPWRWRRTSSCCDVPLAESSTPLQSFDGQPLPLRIIMEDLSDGWHLTRRAGSPSSSRPRRIFRRLGSQICISDEPGKGAPASPFLLAAEQDGTLLDSDWKPVNEGDLWLLARPTGVESYEDRRRVHQMPELKDFRSRLRGLSQVARRDLCQKIGDTRVMSISNAVSNLVKWSSADFRDPYLPFDDRVYGLVAAAAGCYGKSAERLRKKVEREISKNRSKGHWESLAWRSGVLTMKLDQAEVTLLREGEEVELAVDFGESVQGTLCLVAIGEEEGAESAWHE